MSTEPTPTTLQGLADLAQRIRTEAKGRWYGLEHKHKMLAWADEVDATVALRAAQPAAGAVYLVATGETHEGQETYTRHDARPPLCDAECLYPRALAAPIAQAAGWVDAHIELPLVEDAQTTLHATPGLPAWNRRALYLGASASQVQPAGVSEAAIRSWMGDTDTVLSNAAYRKLVEMLCAHPIAAPGQPSDSLRMIAEDAIMALKTLDFADMSSEREEMLCSIVTDLHKRLAAVPGWAGQTEPAKGGV